MGAAPAREKARTAPDFVSPQMAAAMAHPTRVLAFGVLRDRVASPREIAEQIGEPLNNVTYHVNQLRKLGCAELVRTKRVRGGRVVEHFYQAKKHLYFDEDSWRDLTDKQRIDLSLTTLRMLSQDIARSMAAGSFFSDDVHVCRAPMVLDTEGWREASQVLERAVDDLFEVEARVAARATEDAPPDIHTKVGLIQFRAEPFVEKD